MRTVTQKHLAKRLGLSQSTVSLALRGSGEIARETRERVMEAAAAEGYRGDVAVSALAHRRWSAQRGVAIGYIEQTKPIPDLHLPGVRARCTQLGVTLIQLPRPREGGGVARILDQRRLAGLLIAQGFLGDADLALETCRTRVVHCGIYADPGPGDVVAAELVSAATEAWQRVVARGYQRVAVVVVDQPGIVSEHMITGGLLAFAHITRDPRLLPCVLPAYDKRMAASRVRELGADAVIAYSDDLVSLLDPPLPLASLIVPTEQIGRVAGMVLPYDAIGASAVDLLCGALRSPPGFPCGRRLHLIGMTWHDGASLR
jgi:DNA-binding LacI/PurR family transcriptional regulator